MAEKSPRTCAQRLFSVPPFIRKRPSLEKIVETTGVKVSFLPPSPEAVLLRQKHRWLRAKQTVS